MQLVRAYNHGWRDGAAAVYELWDLELDTARAERKIHGNRGERNRVYFDHPEDLSVHRNLDSERAFRAEFRDGVHLAVRVRSAEAGCDDCAEKLLRKVQKQRRDAKRTGANGTHFLWWPAGHEVLASEFRGYDHGIQWAMRVGYMLDDHTQVTDMMSRWIHSVSLWAKEAIEMPNFSQSEFPFEWLPPAPPSC